MQSLRCFSASHCCFLWVHYTYISRINLPLIWWKITKFWHVIGTIMLRAKWRFHEICTSTWLYIDFGFMIGHVWKNHSCNLYVPPCGIFFYEKVGSGVWLCFRYCNGVVPVYLRNSLRKFPILLYPQSRQTSVMGSALSLSICMAWRIRYSFRYSTGDMPSAFLKKRQKYCSFSPMREARSRI